MHGTLRSHLETLVRELALPGGRVVGTAGHATAARWVDWQLAHLELMPYYGRRFALPYSSGSERFTNFAANIPGSNRNLAPVLIGAHYDSVIPHPCADDNAAAVAIVLAIAERLRAVPRERDLVIAIFDAEEPPYFQTEEMGSVRFCEDQADGRGFHAALIFDLVGHDVLLPGLGALTPPSVRRLLFVQGAESHPELADIVNAWRPPGLGVIAALNTYMEDMSDHYAFRRARVPFLFLSCGQWKHYHQPSDTPERLNYHKMRHIAQGMLSITEQIAASELSSTVPDEDFTAKMEAASLQRALGSWKIINEFFDLETRGFSPRECMDSFARKMISRMTL